MDGGDAVATVRTTPLHRDGRRRRGTQTRRFASSQASSHKRRDWRIETRAVALPPYNKNVRCDVLPAPTDHAQELRPVEHRQLDYNKKVRDLKL